MAALKELVDVDWLILQANEKQSQQTNQRYCRVNGDVLHRRCYETLNEFEARNGLLDVHSYLPKILSPLAKAHHDLVDSSGDDHALDVFLIITDNLRVVIKRIRRSR